MRKQRVPLPRRRTSLCLAVLATLVGLQSASAAQDWQKELFITNPFVVDDARASGDGPWSFGTLLGNLSGSSDASVRSKFARHWLERWDDSNNTVYQTGASCYNAIKGDAMRQFIEEWEDASGVDPGGDLDLFIAPFRLLAIVNRIDLLKTSEGQVTSAGEARFVYGAISANPNLSVPASKFFVIFEYGIPASSCAELVSWAAQWRALSYHRSFDEALNIDLQAITDQFTALDVGNDLNGTLINQVRTNDFFLPSQPSAFWELREFNVVPSALGSQVGVLRNVTTKQEPLREFVTEETFRWKLKTYLDQNRDAILAGTHVVPTTFDFGGGITEVFLTGIADNQGNLIPGESGPPPFAIGTRWFAPKYDNAPEVTPESAMVRAGFAQQTCSGCHQQETGTSFSMVKRREHGQESNLSHFLTGTSVQDPLQSGITHQFNDLARRTLAMDRILSMYCPDPVPGFPPVLPWEIGAIQSEVGSRVH